MHNNTLKAHLALLGANIIYGANYLIAKDVMPDKIGPSAFIFVRVLGALLLFWLLKSRIKEQIQHKDYPRLILCGLLGVATNQLLFFHGLNLTSPIDASIIITSIPVMVLIFSAFILKEKITSNKISGLIIGGIGAILLISYGNTSGGTSSILGNVYIFLNACSYGLYLVIVKPLMKTYNAITVISWVFLFGLIFVAPVAIGDVIATDFYSWSTNTYFAVGFVVVFTTFLAYLFNIYALNYVPPSVNGSYVYFQPAITFIIVSIYAFAFRHSTYAQDINLIKILSCLLIFIGVYLIGKTPTTKST